MAHDRSVLVALYEATGGPEWRERRSWLTDRPLSEWHGVTTDRSGLVTELDLSHNKLSGPIPDSLGSLTNLRGLWLGSNKLRGPIPDWASPIWVDLTNQLSLPDTCTSTPTS